MDDVTSKTSGVSGWGPGGRGCGQGGSATVWGAVGWGVQAVQWSEPQGGLGLVREESPACSWGWGLGTESAQLGWYQGWGGGGGLLIRGLSAARSSGPQDPGRLQRPRSYSAGSGQGLLPPPDGVWASEMGSPGHLRGLGPEYWEDSCAPTGDGNCRLPRTQGQAQPG